MEQKNNVVVVLLIVLIGIIAGIGLLVGIGNSVSVALSPVNAKLSEVLIREKNIEDKLNNGGGGNPSGLADIQKQLEQIQNKINAAQPAQPPGPPPEDMNKVYNLPVGVSPVLGKKDAPVAITIFFDFQCPFCSRFYSAVKDVMAAYPDKVKVVVKNFPLPFHPNARPAAKLALAANEQGQYQGMMELLLQNGGDVSDAKIKEYAQSLKLDYNKLMADYKNKDAQWEKDIQDDMQLGSEADVRGTPTFYLDGHKTNARDISGFKAQIDPILAGK